MQKTEDEKMQYIEYWWKQLHQIEQPFLPTSYRAELKRCNSILSIMMTNGFHHLRKELLGDALTNNELQAWAVIACLFAHIKIRHEPSQSIATLLGAVDPVSGKAKMSELRFAQLQNSQNADEFLLRMIRSLKILDGKACPKKIANDVQRWFRDQKNSTYIEPTKRLAVKWALEYYQ